MRLAHLDHLGVVVEALAGQHIPVVEAGWVVDAAVAQVPLADDGGLVAGGLQQLGHGNLAPVKRRGEGGNAVDMVVGAGEDHGAAGRADRVGAEAVVEAHATVGDTVEVGRAVDAAAVAAHGVRRVVVGHDEEDVGGAGRAWVVLYGIANCVESMRL